MTAPDAPSAPAAAGGFRRQLQHEHPGFPAASLSAAAWARLERFADACPLYARHLLAHPDCCQWLEAPVPLTPEDSPRTLFADWQACLAENGPAEEEETRLALLRRWRRRMSLRIAYRDVNELASPAQTVGAMSRLGECCLRECLALARRQWTQRYGEPWDETLNQPARFCVLALGKLGGEELNFSSDIDLIYFYEGEGQCRRDGRAGSFTSGEFFTKVAETATAALQAQTADGFLFRVDVRLRPEGAHGPLVRSLASLENYYAAAGQTWERLAFIKARPVAGDRALGAELLESLHAFRYPRHPPPSLLAEIAAMKARTEQEVVGAGALNRDVKSGFGGIREIEFITQTFQLLHAGRYPFLQTHSTVAALDQLARYRLFAAGDARFLQEAYWFLRRVEHRVQMREERQTHALPAGADELASIARSLGFASAAEFTARLDAARARVRALYHGLFQDRPADSEFENWWIYFSSSQTPEPVAQRVRRWFGGDPSADGALRRFVCGDRRPQVNRELVTRFQHLTAIFDRVLPELARPLLTLDRIAAFAERYGSRQQFFNGCAANPQFFRVLALLFDRSTYIHELLCAHPEIFEEVLRPEILRQRKDAAALREDLAAGAASADFPAWLWLYVKAEQVRYAIGELLGYLSLAEAGAALTLLADAVLGHALEKLDPGQRLLLIALGKYGGGELTFGSDLDLLFLAPETGAVAAERIVRGLESLLGRASPLGAVFEIDLRLRPHGDAGPLAATPAALRAYHAGSAQTWEKQALTLARVVAGAPALAAEFRDFHAALLYGAPLTDAEAQAIWAMRGRIEQERDAVTPPERAFKTGAGGLIDVEFLAQLFQLRHGCSDVKLRAPGTRHTLRELIAAGLLPAAAGDGLSANYDFLRRIELMLRRDAYKGVSVLAATPEERRPLARWLGYAGEAAFWAEHTHRMRATRALVLALLPSLGVPPPA